MKRSIIVLALVLILAGGLGGLAVAEEQAAPETYQGFPVVNVVIGGQDTGLSGILVDGVTYGPVRAIVEALGGKVKWDAETGTAAVEKPAAEVAEAKPAGEAAVAPTGATTTTGTTGTTGTTATEATPEQIAAAEAAYEAAVARADATREAANDALYHRYSWDPSTGAFDKVVYDTLYLPALAAVDAAYAAAIAAALAAYQATIGAP